jgi:AcrR family transcriptional regulator
MREVRRGAVLQATEDLLDETGVASLTLRRVAERAGVALGTVFLYADNKADLVHQVYGHRIAARWHALLDDLSDERPLERVEKFFLGCVDIFFDDRENVMAYYRAMSADAFVSLDNVETLMARVRAALEEAIEVGQIAEDVDAEVLGYSYQALYSNVIMLAARGVDHATARKVIAKSIEQFRRGIEPRPAN